MLCSIKGSAPCWKVGICSVFLKTVLLENRYVLDLQEGAPRKFRSVRYLKIMLSENLVDLFDSKKIPKNRNLVSKHESNQRNKQAFLEKKK